MEQGTPEVTAVERPFADGDTRSRTGHGRAMTVEDTASHEWLAPFLLLSMRRGGAHGRALAEEMRRLGFGGTRPGEVYRALRGLEARGATTSIREGGEISPLKRRYGITAAGEAYLDLWANSLQTFRDETDRFLRAYATLDDAPSNPTCRSERAPSAGTGTRAPTEARLEELAPRVADRDLAAAAGEGRGVRS